MRRVRAYDNRLSEPSRAARSSCLELPCSRLSSWQEERPQRDGRTPTWGVGARCQSPSAPFFEGAGAERGSNLSANSKSFSMALLGSLGLLAATAGTIILLSACAGPRLSAPDHATPIWAMAPQSSPRPIGSPSAAPSHTPVCLDDVTPPPTPEPAHTLHVVYVDQGQVWLWSEGTGQTITLAANVEGAVLSPDGRLLAFWRPLDAQRDEIWVVGTDGTGERRLAVSDDREITERHPEIANLQTSLRLGWLPGTQTLWYTRVPAAFDTGLSPYGETVRLVEASGGPTREVVPPGEVWALAFAPDGRELAALSTRDLRLIDTADGKVTHTVPFVADSTHYQEILFSPDGQQVLVYTKEGLALVDAATGRRRDIPLSYEPLGASEGFAYYPALQWQQDGDSALLVVPNVGSLLDLLNPAATFSLWRLDLAKGTVSRLHTYVGDATQALVSPDQRWVVYAHRAQAQDETAEIYIADVENGRQALCDRGQLLRPQGWLADSTRFVYVGVGSLAKVGQLCGPPVVIGETGPGPLSNSSFHLVEGRDEFLSVGTLPSGARAIMLGTAHGEARLVAAFSQTEQGMYIGYTLAE